MTIWDEIQKQSNLERKGALSFYKPELSTVGNASAITNPTAITSMNSGITSAMPSFASGT